MWMPGDWLRLVVVYASEEFSLILGSRKVREDSEQGSDVIYRLFRTWSMASSAGAETTYFCKG